MTYIASCSIRDRKNGLRFRCLRIRSTEVSNSSSRNIFRPSTSRICAGMSTQMSTSLSGLLSPLATEPNIHRDLTPKFSRIYGADSLNLSMHCCRVHIPQPLSDCKFNIKDISDKTFRVLISNSGIF